jgi:hypothetical protein
VAEREAATDLVTTVNEPKTASKATKKAKK